MTKSEDLSPAILVSREVFTQYSRAIYKACEGLELGRSATILVCDDPNALSKADLERSQVALLSVDIMGSSSKAYDDPKLIQFASVLDQAPNLKWMQICASGMDRALYKALDARGVRITNAAGVNAAPVAQHAVAGMLALVRRLPVWLENQRAHRWGIFRGEDSLRDLSDQHAVVVGTGAIGQNIARILREMGMTVTGVRRSSEPVDAFNATITFADLDDLLPQADWVVLACPLTETTRGLMNETRFNLLKPSTGLVNVARGAVVEEKALVEALRLRRLAMAFLDVFAVEPLPKESPLWDMPGVLISSHNAGSFHRHQEKLVELFKRNLPLFFAGKPLINEALPSG